MRFAPSRTRIGIVFLLLLGVAGCDSSAPPSIEPQPRSPSTLLEAVLMGDRAAVERFIAAGADVTATEIDGTTLVMRAVHGRHPEIVDVLIDAGAQAAAENEYGVTALYLAARNGDAASTRALLAAGAPPNTSLPEGETVLMTAAKSGNPNVVSALLVGVDPDSSTSAQEASFGYSAVSAPPAPRLHGADPNSRDRWYGQTALMWAAAAGRLDVARLLINAGADVNVVDVEGATALMFASSNGHRTFAELLLERGADIGVANRAGDTALHGATRRGSIDVIALLVEHGANVEARNDKGQTALDIAEGVSGDDVPYNAAAADLLRRLAQRS